MPGSATVRIFSGVLLAVLLLPVSRPLADDLDESRRKLQQIERRLRQTSQTLEEKTQAEHQLRSDLRSVRAELERMRRRDTDLENELARIGETIAARQEEAAESRTQIREMEEQVRTRLVALYKTGDAGPLKIVFSSTTPSDMARQFRYFSSVVRHDRQLLDAYRSRLDDLDRTLTKLDRLHHSRRDLHAEVRENRRQLESASSIKRKLLARLRQDKEALAGTMAELRDRKTRLEKLVKKLESASAGKYSGEAGPFSETKGLLPWPVKGRVLVDFGTRENPELGTMHASNGIEIEVADDQPISAVGEGRVVFADTFKGYGNLVIIDHGQSYHSLYGNAARLKAKVGQRVSAGDVLAFSGYPGTSGLYFEIRHHGVPLDPMAWIGPPGTPSARRKD